MAKEQNDDQRVWIDNKGVIHVEDGHGARKTGSNSKSSSGGGISWLFLIMVAVLGFAVLGGGGGASDTTESSSSTTEYSSSTTESSSSTTEYSSNQESGTTSVAQEENKGTTVFVDSDGWLTAEGTLQRLEQTTSQTGMGWSRVAYLLVFDTSVPISYTDGFGNSKQEYMDCIAVDVVEQSGDDADRNLNLATIDKWEPYVGQRITVTGRLFDSGTAHTVGPVMLVDSRKLS